MSVWASVEALFAFTYQSAHRMVMARRRDWFQRPEGAYQVLWWVRKLTGPRSTKASLASPSSMPMARRRKPSSSRPDSHHLTRSGLRTTCNRTPTASAGDEPNRAMIDRAIVEREESARRTAPSLRQAIRRPPPGPGAAALRLPDHVREAARDASDSRLQVAGARREASREPSLARGVRGRKRHATGPAIEPSSVRTGPGSFASTTTLLSRPTGRALLGCLARLHY